MTSLDLPGLRVSCLYAPQLGGIQFWIAERTMTGFRYGELILEEEPADGAAWKEPSFYLSREQATILINELWTAGIRPTGIGDQGETVSALKAHLDDMRKIAFDFLNVRENEV